MLKIITLITLFILNLTILKADVVNDLVISGNKRVSDETIKIYGEIDISKDITENELDKILKNLYSTNFFEDVKVQIKNNKLEIVLKEYPVINQLILIGEESNKYKELIKKTIRLKEKKSFIKSFLAKDLETIKKLYSSLGYNFSKVEAKIKTNESDNLDLIIEINRGGKTKISSINFVGNKVIKAKRLREIIASEENKFWKFISRNTILSENLISLDRRLLINY